MKTRERILKHLKEKGAASGAELANALGMTRQAVNKHIKELVQDSKVVKEGSTRATVYRYANFKHRAPSQRRITKTYFLKGLEEDKVFYELAGVLNLRRELSKNAADIAHYAFTEMLNNAIDHSYAKECAVAVRLDPYKFTFQIRDFGIGIFYSIFKKFGLPDEDAAIGELIKGKTTTMAEKHSGEGIFYTSKAADVVHFRSHKIQLIFDNQKRDVFVEQKKFIAGTEVVFSISKKSKRKLNELFDRFAPQEFDYRFERTTAQVKLFSTDYVSRSEAKRMLHGLDKFKEITLDFAGVKAIGQGFADEIFRVFKKAHPEIVIKIENLSPTLKPIISHVVDNPF
ncbi:MAG: STAS-like domain-containing protein [bacterium]